MSDATTHEVVSKRALVCLALIAASLVVAVELRNGSGRAPAVTEAALVNVDASSKAGAMAAPPPKLRAAPVKAATATAAAAVPFIGGTSGKLFTGAPFREFPASRLIGTFTPRSGAEALAWPAPAHSNCVDWAVVTTIFDISPGIERALGLGNHWCTVVVADRKTPAHTYEQRASRDPRLVLLTVAQQEVLAQQSPYVASVPWNHFGRKNLGYLYAVHRKARYIFDFDDDNILFDAASSSSDSSNSGQSVAVVPATPANGAVDEVNMASTEVVQSSNGPVEALLPVFNPYPLMGSTNPEAWPRGFPLDHITRPATWQAPRTSGGPGSFARVGVWQSLANHDPDVDALLRLTQRHNQFDFAARAEPVALGAGTLAPYNAQACTHAQAAHWLTLLPTSVPGRVSDIWRGYVAQRSLWDVGLRLGFMAPAVRQDRSPHSFLADADAEVGLYFKATKLAELLAAWPAPSLEGGSKSSGGGASAAGRLEQMYAALYARGYLEESDVVACQLWLQALADAGYEFPPLVHSTAAVAAEATTAAPPAALATTGAPSPTTGAAAAPAAPATSEDQDGHIVKDGSESHLKPLKGPHPHLRQHEHAYNGDNTKTVRKAMTSEPEQQEPNDKDAGPEEKIENK